MIAVLKNGVSDVQKSSLIIEVHNDPEHALCDGAQSLTPERFTKVADKVSEIRKLF